MKTFKNKVAVVTGAGSGIGRHLAMQLSQAGAELALSDINAAGLAETLSMLAGQTRVKTYLVDVSKKEHMFAHAVDVKRDFGTAHIVFNNAGVTVLGTVEHLTLEEIEWQLAINLWGVIYGTKAFLPMLLSQKEGHIVNMSSVFGIVAFPGQSAYNMSKFAVRAWTECLWRELEGTGVQATSVHPGGIKTELGHTARISVNAGQVEQRFVELAEKLLITPPEHAARSILSGVLRGKKRIVCGNKAATLVVLQRLMPTSYGRAVKLIERFS